MTATPSLRLAALLLGSTLAMAAAASAQSHDHSHDNNQDHSHDHDHAHDDSEAARQIYAGYFEDSQVQDRPLSDYEGAWRSVYPLLQDGTLAPVMAHKAETGNQTAEEYTAYYEIGYATDTDRITIEGDQVTFHQGESERDRHLCR